MRVFTGRADILLMINELIDWAERTGCRVVRRISFHPDMAIHIPPVADEATLYALAHEMGHLMDYLAGTLDYQLWKNKPAVPDQRRDEGVGERLFAPFGNRNAPRRMAAAC